MTIPTLIEICVIAPNRPLSEGGATSDMYSGTMTVEAPAPIPARNRPSDINHTAPASVSSVEPRRKNRLVNRIARSLPRLLDRGPATNAPARPPTTNMEFIAAN